MRPLLPLSDITIRPRFIYVSLHSRKIYYLPNRTNREMGSQQLPSTVRKPVKFRLCNVSGYTAELLEIRADDPSLHVLLIPGNPGVITFYKDFVESLYELLGGSASITAIGHTGQTKKNWEPGKLFSLQEQVDHKIDYIRQELLNIKVPLVLVGHSIGSYIAVQMLRRSPVNVLSCVGLYPFIALNRQSKTQFLIGKIALSGLLSTSASLLIASLSLLPRLVLKLIVRNSLGRCWSAAAVEAACSHLPQYHVMRNVLFMAMTEFRKLSETPDWEFMRENKDKLMFLFGIDDHWGPLEMFEEISEQAPDIRLTIEREGHTHGFCCTEAGSFWVADYVASLIKGGCPSSSW